MGAAHIAVLFRKWQLYKLLWVSNIQNAQRHQRLDSYTQLSNGLIDTWVRVCNYIYSIDKSDISSQLYVCKLWT